MRREALTPPEGESSQLTSLIDVSFLLLIFFMCLPFRSLDHKLECMLPTDAGIHSTFVPPPKETVRIHIELAGKDPVFKLGQHVAPSAEALKPTLRRLGPDYAYEIDAKSNVRWENVVDAVNVLRAVDCPDVRFRGSPPPSTEIRRRLH